MQRELAACFSRPKEYSTVVLTLVSIVRRYSKLSDLMPNAVNREAVETASRIGALVQQEELSLGANPQNVLRRMLRYPRVSAMCAVNSPLTVAVYMMNTHPRKQAVENDECLQAVEDIRLRQRTNGRVASSLCH